jgi:hypothetical protein
MRTGTTAHKEGGEALHRRSSPDKFATASSRLRETASVEFGGFSRFRAVVKVRIVKAAKTLPRREKVARENNSRPLPCVRNAPG